MVRRKRKESTKAKIARTLDRKKVSEEEKGINKKTALKVGLGAAAALGLGGLYLKKRKGFKSAKTPIGLLPEKSTTPRVQKSFTDPSGKRRRRGQLHPRQVGEPSVGRMKSFFRLNKGKKAYRPEASSKGRSQEDQVKISVDARNRSHLDRRSSSSAFNKSMPYTVDFGRARTAKKS